MSGLNLLGGLAQGVTQGLNNTMTIQNNRARQKESEARLQMLQDEHSWRKEDRDRQSKDRERLDGWNTLSMRIDTEYQDRDPMERNAMKIKYGVDTGLIAPDEFKALQQQHAEMQKAGLLDDILTGNMQGLSQKFSQRYGQPVQVVTAKDATGRPVYRAVDQSGRALAELTDEQLGIHLGLDQLLKMGDLRRTDEKHQSGLRETDSKIAENRAQAGAASALARQRGLENEGLAALTPEQRATRGSGGAAGPQSTIGKEAADMVRMGLAKDEGEALQILRTDKSLSQAVQIVMSNPASFTMTADQLAAATRKTADVLRAREGAGGGGDPLGLFQ